jgi:hypothetical protein
MATSVDSSMFHSENGETPPMKQPPQGSALLQLGHVAQALSGFPQHSRKEQIYMAMLCDEKTTIMARLNTWFPNSFP